MEVAVFGGEGQLGSAVVRHLRGANHLVHSPSHSVLDITDFRAVADFLATGSKSGAVINCAAVTDMATCEENPELAHLVNTSVVEWLSRCTFQCQQRFISFSTDQVLRAPPGLQDEDSLTYYFNVYSRTKRTAELAMRSYGTVVRVSTLYGHDPCRGKSRPNFVEQVLRSVGDGKDIELPFNVGCSPCYVEEAGEALVQMLSESTLPPIVHLTPRRLGGLYSWFTFARDVVDLCHPDNYTALMRVKSRTHGGPSTGLVNMATRHRWRLPPVRESLSRYLGKRKRVRHEEES